MVDHSDGAYAIPFGQTSDESGGFKQVGVIDVGDDEHRTGGQHLLGGVPVDEGVLVLGESIQMGAADTEGVVCGVGDDVHGHRGSALRGKNAAAEAVSTDRRADGVEVGVLVTHDEHVVAVGQMSLDEVSADARGDGGVALQRLMRAAKVGHAGDTAAYERDLVAASSEGDLQRVTRGGVSLLHAAVHVGDTHGDRHGEAVITHADLHDLAQNGEVILNTSVQHLLGEECQILVAVVLAEHTVHALHPAG